MNAIQGLSKVYKRTQSNQPWTERRNISRTMLTPNTEFRNPAGSRWLSQLGRSGIPIGSRQSQKGA